MENIIILILFTYPGIMADFIHSRLSQKTVHDRKPEEYFKVARDFFLSALISVVSIKIYCMITDSEFSISTAVERFGKDESIWGFGLITIVVAVAAALIWKLLDDCTLWIRNKIREKQGKSTTDKIKSVWESMFDDEELKFDESAMAIYQNGQLIRAGLSYNVSNDYQNDPWATLIYTETVEEELRKEKKDRTMLIDPTASLINIENGVRVDLYNAKKLKDYIQAWRDGLTCDPEEKAEGLAPAEDAD